MSELEALRFERDAARQWAALWKRSVKRDYKAHIELLVALCNQQATVNTLISEHDALAAANQRLREGIRDFAEHGIRADCNPTMPAGGRDTGWWYDYLHHADQRVRERARALLAELPAGVVGSEGGDA